MRVVLSAITGCLFASQVLADCQPIADAGSIPLSADTTIRSITYSPNNVFDLTDKNTFWLHNFANYTHTVTHESVIADDLLFHTGGVLVTNDLAETERLLRSRNYLREAKVTVSHYCAEDNSVIVNVETWDNWSLLPTVDFSSEGGRSKSALGFEEDNFLGTGNKLSVEYRKETERSGYGFAFISPNMFGSFWNGTLRYFKNSDGDNYQLEVRRPFYRLSSPWALGFNIQRISEEVSEYEAAEEVNSFQRQNNIATVEFGYKLDISSPNVHRIKMAAEINDFNFYEAEQGSPFGIPEDRNLSGAWLEYEFIEVDYRKLFNINTFNRTEDFNFGWQINTKLGQYHSGLGASEQALFWDLKVEKNWQLASDLWLFSDAGWLHRNFDDPQFLLSNHWQLIKQLNNYNSLVAKVTMEKGHDLFRDEPLYIGGKNDMRAYPEYFRSGDARLIGTAEYRRYTDWSLWQLLDVAFAGYVDVGKVWGINRSDTGHSDSTSLVGIGSGVRLLSSHSSRGIMIHLDVTKALTDNDNLSGVEIRVMASQNF